jgi:riboflavin-specific deaminase-like protein
MRLPAVAANFALSLDGKIAARAKGPASFTSAADRRRMLELRAEADAILLGRGTLEADDIPMRLPSARLRARRIRAGKTAEPLRVIFTNSGRIRKNLRVFREGGAPVVVFTTRSMPAATKNWLQKVAGVHIEPRAKTVDLRNALRILARDYGVRSALCEGGAELFRALVQAGLVRTLYVTFAPVIIGGADAPTLLGPAHSSLLKSSIALRLEKFSRRASETFATYRVASGSEPRQ